MSSRHRIAFCLFELGLVSACSGVSRGPAADTSSGETATGTAGLGATTATTEATAPGAPSGAPTHTSGLTESADTAVSTGSGQTEFASSSDAEITSLDSSTNADSQGSTTWDPGASSNTEASATATSDTGVTNATFDSNSGESNASAEIPTLEDGSPLLLSQTGLYEADMVTLAAGVRPFEPRFPLWTDTASKRRWIWIPEGEQIDTSDMDYWKFPTGTKLFKEFTRGTTRVETRVLTKNPRGGWRRAAYQWREDQLEADALIEAVPNASGTAHDIPSQEDCGTCHFQTTDKILGFSAIQLDWDNPEEDAWTLDRLSAAGLLSEQPPVLQLPGDETAQAALGYMHGNCGHCHNPKSSVLTRVTISLWLRADALGSVEETPTYLDSVCKTVSLEEGGVPGIDKIIEPGSPDSSALVLRFDSRGETYSMPPIGTEDVHTAALEDIRAWIESLANVTCPN